MPANGQQARCELKIYHKRKSNIDGVKKKMRSLFFISFLIGVAFLLHFIVGAFLAPKAAKETFNTKDHTSNNNITSKLFPQALDMMKRGVPLENEYTCFDENNSFSLVEAKKDRGPPLAGMQYIDIDAELRALGEKNANTTTACSCGAPTNTPEGRSALCCQRRVYPPHKMGTFFLFSIRDKMKGSGVEIGSLTDWKKVQREQYQMMDHLLQPRIDFRDATILRNIYDSLISGYLYHKEGKECWLDWNGEKQWKNPDFFTGRWMKHIDLMSQKSKPYATLCHCLANETEANGMKIYVDWVFHAYYDTMLEFWALSNGWTCQSIQRRVKFFCFEDVTSKTSSSAAVGEMIDFLTDDIKSDAAARSEQLSKKEDSAQAYDGGHSTSRDPTLRQRLLTIVKQIDHEHYNDDIAWLHSILPCQ